MHDLDSIRSSGLLSSAVCKLYAIIGCEAFRRDVNVLQGFSSLFAAILALSFVFGRSIQNM
eukprot:scaffold461158_cov29-Prasinocladus_malaysianus.AAC.1